MSHPIQDPRPSPSSLLRDPGIRAPLKAVLRLWSDPDPLDAAEDAALLALALERRADERLARLGSATPTHRAPEGLS